MWTHRTEEQPPFDEEILVIYETRAHTARWLMSGAWRVDGVTGPDGSKIEWWDRIAPLPAEIVTGWRTPYQHPECRGRYVVEWQNHNGIIQLTSYWNGARFVKPKIGSVSQWSVLRWREWAETDKAEFD
jgi:hypothetical protein